MKSTDMPIIGDMDLSNCKPLDMEAELRKLKELSFPDGYKYGQFDFEDELFNADPNCKHYVVAQNRGGIKCIHCGGWFCY